MGGDYIINIIELIISALFFALGYVIWVKVVDYLNDWLKEKLSEKTYGNVMICIFVMFFIAVIYLILK